MSADDMVAAAESWGTSAQCGPAALWSGYLIPVAGRKRKRAAEETRNRGNVSLAMFASWLCEGEFASGADVRWCGIRRKGLLTLRSAVAYGEATCASKSSRQSALSRRRYLI